MRSIYIDDRPTDDRPLISKNSNGHISATDHPIHFMFDSRVGFSGTANPKALFRFEKSKMTAAAILEKFQMPYLRNRSSDPLHLWF